MRNDPRNPPHGMVRPPAPLAKQTDTRLAAENRSMRETIVEYIVARSHYEAATAKPNSHAPPTRVSHGDQRVLRYLDARAALDRMVSCGTCGTPIQADPMTGTTCACAPTIPNDRRGDLGLFKSGTLAVLQAHIAEYGFDGEIAEAVAAVAELVAAEQECDSANIAVGQAMLGTEDSKSMAMGMWLKAYNRRAAALRAFQAEG